MTDENSNLQNWKRNALKELKKKDIDGIFIETPEGINIKPLYTSEDIKNIQHLNSYPGAEPFLRGPKATMYTGRPWTIRQYAGFSTAKESNQFYKKNYSLGIGLSLSKRLNFSDFCMTAINFAYFRVLLAVSINKSQSIFIKN